MYIESKYGSEAAMGGVGGAQRPVMRVNEPRQMGFEEPTSLLDLLSISYVITIFSMVQKI